MKRLAFKRPTLAPSLALVLGLAAASAGCATSAPERTVDPEQAQKLALYRSHAGAPVGSIPFSRTIDNWTYLGERTLAVWTSPSRAWLLELSSRCQELEHAHSIGFDSRGMNISAGFDSVRVVSPTAALAVPCRIETIQPLDVPAIRAIERGE